MFLEIIKDRKNNQIEIVIQTLSQVLYADGIYLFP